jgi:hypothetical protein
VGHLLSNGQLPTFGQQGGVKLSMRTELKRQNRKKKPDLLKQTKSGGL